MNIKAGHISITTLSDLSNRDKLIIPSYQRQYCWNDAKACRLGVIDLDTIKLLDTLDSALERFKTIELLHFTFSGTDSEIQIAFDRINEKGVAFTPEFKPVKKSELLKF